MMKTDSISKPEPDGSIWDCCKILSRVLKFFFFGSLVLIIAIILAREVEREDEKASIISLGAQNGGGGGGGIYIRWGRTSCPDTPGTELVYAGRAAGSHYKHGGGGANYLCVTEDPQSLRFLAGENNAAILYGSEYQADHNNLPHRRLHDQDVPCALCHMTARRAVFMLPGRYECPSGWTREYHGYLVAAHHKHHRSMFECMDIAAEKVDGGHANHDGALFYHVEPRCGSLPCPRYENTKEMTCAVCSK